MFCWGGWKSEKDTVSVRSVTIPSSHFSKSTPIYTYKCSREPSPSQDPHSFNTHTGKILLLIHLGANLILLTQELGNENTYSMLFSKSNYQKTPSWLSTCQVQHPTMGQLKN